MKTEEITLDRQELALAIGQLDLDTGGLRGFFEGKTTFSKSTSYGDLEMTVLHEGIVGGHSITIKKTYKS